MTTRTTIFALVLFACATVTAGFALDLRLTEVTYLPADGSPAIALQEARVSSYSPTPVAPPHWTADKGVQPAVFVRGSAMQVNLGLKVDGAPDGRVLVYGTCPLFDVPAAEVAFDEDGTARATLAVDGRLPNVVGAHDASVQWFARVVGDSTVAEQPLATTPVRILTTFKAPIAKGRVFKELVEWSCRFAAGLDDDKAIADALITNLHETGLHYGRRGWSTFDILKNKGGMCGGWCMFFRDYCATQGVVLVPWFFTLEKNSSEGGQMKWEGIDIHAGGLNNPEPTFKVPAYLIDEVYPNPRYFGRTSPDDDVTYFPSRAMYQFQTVVDGHCVNFLNYGGKQFMYDPSFGTGPFGGFFEGDIPEQTPMTGASLDTFRQVYFDRGVDHLNGRIAFVDADGATAAGDLDPKTTLVSNDEMHVVWENLSAMMEAADASESNVGLNERQPVFARLYGLRTAKAGAGLPAVDYLSAFRAIEAAGKPDRATVDEFRTLLTLRKPLATVPGTQLPGVLPPLQMLQAAVVRWAERTGTPGLDREIELLRNEATGWFRQLIAE